MKKLLFLSLPLAITLSTGASLSAQPTSWYGKLAATPIQLVHHNAYVVAGCVTTPLALLGAAALITVYSNPEQMARLAAEYDVVANILTNNNPALFYTALAGTWAGLTYTGGKVIKSVSKSIMNVFDIPELE